MRACRWWVALCLLTSSAGAQDAGRELLWQTNAGGDDVHVIDVRTGALADRLVVGPSLMAWPRPPMAEPSSRRSRLMGAGTASSPGTMPRPFGS
jgi:hypothetical protein